jgi:hypothetical protein
MFFGPKHRPFGCVLILQGHGTESGVDGDGGPEFAEVGKTFNRSAADILPFFLLFLC